jgi:hypothetical protein
MLRPQRGLRVMCSQYFERIDTKTRPTSEDWQRTLAGEGLQERQLQGPGLTLGVVR